MRILVFLARRKEDVPAKKKEISEAEGISAGYVEQILVRLKAAGLVRSHRGKRGGFSLARDPADITVADVVSATEGRVELAPCLSSKCRRSCTCPTRPLWEEATAAMQGVFGKTTIARIVENAAESEDKNAIVYNI